MILLVGILALATRQKEIIGTLLDLICSQILYVCYVSGQKLQRQVGRLFAYRSDFSSLVLRAGFEY